jgi:hypothetical protein
VEKEKAESRVKFVVDGQEVELYRREVKVLSYSDATGAGMYHCFTHQKSFLDATDMRTHLGSGKHLVGWVSRENGPETMPPTRMHILRAVK